MGSRCRCLVLCDRHGARADSYERWNVAQLGIFRVARGCWYSPLVYGPAHRLGAAELAAHFRHSHGAECNIVGPSSTTMVARRVTRCCLILDRVARTPHRARVRAAQRSETGPRVRSTHEATSGLPATRPEDSENLNGSADEELRADGTSARDSDSTSGQAQRAG